MLHEFAIRRAQPFRERRKPMMSRAAMAGVWADVMS